MSRRPRAGKRSEPVRRPRKLARPELDAGPQQEIRDLLYDLHEKAGRPALEVLEQLIAADDRLEGSPKKDRIHKIIVKGGPAGLDDVRAVARTLASACGQDEYAAAARVAQLMDPSRRLHAATTDQPAAPVARLGRPVDDCDPLELEVYRAIQVPGGGTTDVLPSYVQRIHDVRLRELVDGMLAEGRSRLVTLVGGSSTGKTRAGWELAQYLESQQPGLWRLWHPLGPTRPEAVLAGLEKAGPDTIVWLNEAQHYLMPPGPGLGERTAAGLRSLLADPGRGPVLVLATLRTDYWNTLTTRPTGASSDVYGQVRDLLAIGTAVTFTDAFTTAELAGLAGPGVDARLRYAADHAEGGRITQYLAGAPVLENRYRTAVKTMPAARAVLQVAIDARRLGHPLALPQALLEQAAPGYLDDHDWDIVGEDWLEQTLAYTAQSCKGTRGLLTRLRARPGEPPLLGGQPCYRLAGDLEELGRSERAGVYPPDSFWQALITTGADADLLSTLGAAAALRGRYQHAFFLYRRAADCGDTDALLHAIDLRRRAGDMVGAEEMAVQAADRGDTFPLLDLAGHRESAGDAAGAEKLYRQAADRGDTEALNALARRLELVGDVAGAQVLYRRAADRGDSFALIILTTMLDAAGVEALHQQAADHGNIFALQDLARCRELAGDTPSAEALYRRAADRGDTAAVWELARLRVRAGDMVGAEALAVQAAERGNHAALGKLDELLERGGNADDVESLAVRVAAHGYPFVLRRLAELRARAGDIPGAEKLYRKAADRGDIRVLLELARLREWAGDMVGAEALAVRAAERGDIRVLLELARLRERAGDMVGAEALVVQAANHGYTTALGELAWWRELAKDDAGAEALYRRAAGRGDTFALRQLARLREQAGDAAGAEELHRQAINRGNAEALHDLAGLLERSGDHSGAVRVRRFGLTGSGDIATGLNFGSYGGLLSH